MDKTIYKDDSIESLDPLSFCRLRPQVYCGNTEYSTQLLVEILSNSIDEYTLGHGNLIDITITDDNVISVEDLGQGFPIGVFDDEGKSVVERAFSVLNTSGKYREDGTYEGISLGMYGIGSKLACYLSHWLEVTTYNNGKYEKVHFTEGVLDNREIGETANYNGTKVTWNPSEEFFTDPHININEIKKLIKTLVCLCPGLTIRLNKEVFHSNNGLNDLVDEAVKDTEVIKNRLIIDKAIDKNKLNLVMTYTSAYSSTIVPYVNTGLTEQGPHITQIKTALTREMNKFFRDKKWLKDKEDNLTGEDISEGLYIAFNITSAGVAYDAQIKSRLTKIDTKPIVQMFTEGLTEWLTKNEKEVHSICDKALSARKAREAAKKARDAVRNNPKDKKSKLLNLPTKLIDAYSKDRSICELYISEGDSAASGLVNARNPETQAVFPVRGKVISCLKQSDEKIFANQEVVNLVKAIGLDLDPKTKKLVYDTKKLRYGKIILACDADSDGANIKNLLLTMFWALCPELVTNGHIYAAVPPLFRITNKKNEYIYLKDIPALEEYKAKHSGEKYLVSRNKGLGEQDTHELGECIVDPKTRVVNQVTVADEDAADKLFDILMGPAVPPRREYILQHSEEVTELEY